MSEEGISSFSRNQITTAEEAFKVVSWAAKGANEVGLNGVAQELALVGVFLGNLQSSLPPVKADGSLTLDNASVQRLMDYGLLHHTDEGWIVSADIWNKPKPVKGTIVERVARAIYAAHPVIEFYERGPTDPLGNRWLSWDQIPQGHRDRMVECATAAIEAMPIQKMVEGLRELLRTEMLEQPTTGERETYSDGYSMGLCRAITRIDSLLASVRSDGEAP